MVDRMVATGLRVADDSGRDERQVAGGVRGVHRLLPVDADRPTVP
jgi:hypothetical protein